MQVTSHLIARAQTGQDAYNSNLTTATTRDVSLCMSEAPVGMAALHVKLPAS